MAWLHENQAVQQLSKSAILYDLSQIRGTSALLSRIPEQISGVYAWYRRFELPPIAKDNPDLFVKYLIDELSKEQFAPRQTRIPPSQRLILQSDNQFSKKYLLEKFSLNHSFRELIFNLLENSILFQQPLYIGKAINLNSRISNHLREGSILRQRLTAAGHNINRCRLLLMYSVSVDDISSVNVNTPNQENYENELENLPVDESEFSELDAEALIEDILSRLFLPPFTLRYG